ncbi:hypothetical protein LSAT2_030219 [Lamellibrachia satsuma]|nr:hypothetical protein LSAT2_030219 [Lamellibrachia satsuma]
MCVVALMCLFSLRLHKARLPLPTWNRKEGCVGQFGWPTFGAGAFARMFAATIATTIESVGVGYATARICALPPPPKHTINRGIAIEGLASVLSGFFGVCHGTTTYSTAIGFIGVTGAHSQSMLFEHILGLLGD